MTTTNILPRVASLGFDLRYISGLAISTPGCLRSDLGQLQYPVDPLIKQGIKNHSESYSFSYAPTYGDAKLLDVLKVYDADLLDHFEKPGMLVTSGGQAGLYASIHSIIGPGDGILTDKYYYPPYAGICKQAGGNFIQYDFEDIENCKEVENVKLLILNSPNNPSGKVYELDTLKKIAILARKHNWIILEDAVYNKIYYEIMPVSIATLCPERTLVLNSASKNLAMPGIRIGWLYGEESLIISIAKVHRNMNSCPNSFFQKVLADYIPSSDNYFKALRIEMKLRRDMLLNVFRELGWKYQLPGGAIYVMAIVPGLKDPMNFAENMIRKAKVSAMPGHFFGNHPDHMRFCFGALEKNEIEILHERINSIL